MQDNHHKYEHLIYSAVGLVALFLMLVALNFLLSLAPVRADLTTATLYAVAGHQEVLRNLQSPVKVKLYTRRARACRCRCAASRSASRTWCASSSQAGGNNVIIERYNPRPDSEEEDAAQLDGIEPQQLAKRRAVLSRRGC